MSWAMGAVNLRLHGLHAGLAVGVHVEAAERLVLVFHLDEARAAFDEPPGEEAAEAEAVADVVGFGGLGFFPPRRTGRRA